MRGDRRLDGGGTLLSMAVPWYRIPLMLTTLSLLSVFTDTTSQDCPVFQRHPTLPFSLVLYWQDRTLLVSHLNTLHTPPEALSLKGLPHPIGFSKFLLRNMGPCCLSEVPSLYFAYHLIGMDNIGCLT